MNIISESSYLVFKKCGSVASYPDTAVLCFVNEHRIYVDFYVNKYEPIVLNSTWVMLIKSQYNKQHDKDGFYIYKAPRKFISQH